MIVWIQILGFVLFGLNYLNVTKAKNTDCQYALGMENGMIADSQISASTEGSKYRAAEARLDGPYAWRSSPEDPEPWIQVNFQRSVYVTGVATQNAQGHLKAEEFVKEYTISYSQNGVSFQSVMEDDKEIVFYGGEYDDRETQLFQELQPIRLTIIRINAIQCETRCDLRFELYGCDGLNSTTASTAMVTKPSQKHTGDTHQNEVILTTNDKAVSIPSHVYYTSYTGATIGVPLFIVIGIIVSLVIIARARKKKQMSQSPHSQSNGSLSPEDPQQIQLKSDGKTVTQTAGDGYTPYSGDLSKSRYEDLKKPVEEETEIINTYMKQDHIQDTDEEYAEVEDTGLKEIQAEVVTEYDYAEVEDTGRKEIKAEVVLEYDYAYGKCVPLSYALSTMGANQSGNDTNEEPGVHAAGGHVEGDENYAVVREVSTDDGAADYDYAYAANPVKVKETRNVTPPVYANNSVLKQHQIEKN